MKKSLWMNMVLGGLIATGLGIMAIGTFSDSLYKTNQEAEGYPFEADVASAGGGETAGPELMPDWGTLFADPAKLAEFTAQGEKATGVCKSCHDLSPAGANNTGPGLAGIVGRKSGTHAGFAYSDAMKAHAVPWTYDELYLFLKNPKALVKGTSMSYAGMPKSENRIAVVAYLKSISPNAPAIPAPDPTRDPAKAAAAAAAPEAAGNEVAAANEVSSAPEAAANAVDASAPAKK